MFEFSVRKTIAVTFITAVVSGVVGAVVNNYVTRAKPTIAVTSLGFEADVIETDDAVRKASVKDQWGPPLQRYVKFDALINRERSSSEILLQLKSAREEAEEWLTSAKDKTGTQLTAEEVLQVPHMSTQANIMGSHIMGELRTRRFDDLPVPLEKVREYKPLWPLESHASGWHLHLGTAGMNFPEDEKFGEKEHALQELMAESFSRGVTDNIIRIHEVFVSTTAKEILELQELIDSIRSNLRTDARLAVTVSVGNVGGTPVILQPYLVGIAVLGDETSSFVLNVEASNDASDEIEFLLRAMESPSEVGEPFLVEDYLAKASKSPYVSVGRGESRVITMTSLGPISDKSDKFFEFYELGAVKFQVVAQTLEGRSVESESLTFGRKISDMKRQELLELKR